MASSLVQKPVRIGVFSTIGQAERAVNGLMEAGFGQDQITVICSDQAKEEHFHEYEHQFSAGSQMATAAAAGGGIGLLLGGLAALGGLVTTGGVGILAAGAILGWAGAHVGGLVGAMMTRGIEKEAADFYDQAVTRGKILVAAEDHTDQHAQRLARAEQIFAEAGAEPIKLPEG